VTATVLALANKQKGKKNRFSFLLVYPTNKKVAAASKY